MKQVRMVCLSLALVALAALAVAAQPTTVVLQPTQALGNGNTAAIGLNTQATIQVTTAGSFNGTVTFSLSLDGNTYTAIGCYDTSTSTLTTTATGAGIFVCPVANGAFLRAPLTGTTTGTATVVARLATGTANIYTFGSSSGGTGTGDVVASGALTTNRLIVGNGATGVKAAAALTGLLQSDGSSVPSALAPTDDNIVLGNGTNWELKALPNCTDTGGNHLNYTAATNSLSCGTSGGGSGTPGGSTTQVQFNDAGSFAGDAGLTYNKTTDTLTVGAINTGTTGPGAVEMTCGTTTTSSAGTVKIECDPSNVFGYSANGGAFTPFGGAGTVTHTTGALTADAYVTGNGTADIKVATVPLPRSLGGQCDAVVTTLTSTAIQAAVDSLASTGGNVCHIAGTYVLTTKITNGDGAVNQLSTKGAVKLIGVGARTSISAYTAVPHQQTIYDCTGTADGDCINFNGPFEGWGVIGIELLGVASGSSSIGIKGIAVNQGLIQNVRIFGFKYGMYLSTQTAWTAPTVSVGSQWNVIDDTYTRIGTTGSGNTGLIMTGLASNANSSFNVTRNMKILTISANQHCIQLSWADQNKFYDTSCFGVSPGLSGTIGLLLDYTGSIAGPLNNIFLNLESQYMVNTASNSGTPPGGGINDNIIYALGTDNGENIPNIAGLQVLGDADYFIGAPGRAFDLRTKISRYNDAAITNGQTLCGNTSTGKFDACTLTGAGAATVTNGAGAITVTSKTPVYKNGTLVGTRSGVNVVEGSNVTLTVADNSGSDRVDVTVASSGGGSGTTNIGLPLFATTTLAGPDNTATETSLLGGTQNIPGGTFSNGQVFHFEVAGVYSRPAVTTDNLALNIGCGSGVPLTTIIGTVTISGSTLAVSQTDEVFRLQGDIHIIGSGSSGTVLLNTIAELTGSTLTPQEAKVKNTSAIALDFTAACLFNVTAKWGGATSGQKIQGIGSGWFVSGSGGVLTQVASTDANTTMAVNTHYFMDLSGFTADRTYTLPTSCAVGDRIRMTVGTGSNSNKVKLTAATSDTLNGVAGGTVWSSLFITNESVTIECVATNSAWIVTTDKRIPQICSMNLSTATTGNEPANTYVQPSSSTCGAGSTACGGIWTIEKDQGGLCSTSTGRATLRRDGSFTLRVTATPLNVPASAKYMSSGAFKNAGATQILRAHYVSSGSLDSSMFTDSDLFALVDTDFIEYRYRSEEGNKGINGSSTDHLSHFTVMEHLP